MQTFLKILNLKNACQIYFVECVNKMRHILSVIHYTIRGAVCFQFTHFLVMIERIYILCLIIIIQSEVWAITHCLGLGHETMVYAVCLFVFLFLLNLVEIRLFHMPFSITKDNWRLNNTAWWTFHICSHKIRWPTLHICIHSTAYISLSSGGKCYLRNRVSTRAFATN